MFLLFERRRRTIKKRRTLAPSGSGMESGDPNPALGAGAGDNERQAQAQVGARDTTGGNTQQEHNGSGGGHKQHKHSRFPFIGYKEAV